MPDPSSQPDRAASAPDAAPSSVDAVLAAVLDRCDASGAVQVELQFADVTGAVKSVFVPVRRLEDALRSGEWFDGSAVEGLAREVESDMYLRPDPATFGLGEPTDGVVCARLICDVTLPDGEPYPGDSRSTLRSVVDAARDAGFEYRVAPEVEFFLFPADHEGSATEEDPSSYFERSRGHLRQVELEIVAGLEALGIPVESSHHEVAAGQFELDLPFLPALASADALTTLKPAVKELARRSGLLATFMPKPLEGAAGSGMHTHQVLLDAEGRNAFEDPADHYGLSSIGRAFAAGQLAHAPGMSALVAPLVNSYKRLVPGYEAPVAGSWGRHNRSALIRVPLSARPVDGSAGPGTRLELRLPDPSCNPYLAFAAMLVAGMDGVERDLELGPPMEEIEHDYGSGGRRSVRALPGSLGEALVALDDDDVLVDALGSELVELFRTAKQLEWASYLRQVTTWEVAAYRERY